MPPVVKVGDRMDLVPASLFPCAKFPFQNFNQVQSRIFEFYDKDANCLIAANTSAGKTVCAEMFLSYEVRKRGGKGLYLAPLRALAQEKIDDWTDKAHHFGDLKTAICTGDYRLTGDRRKELEQADLVVMTSELLNHLCRNYASEKARFLADVGTIVTDEAHLIGEESRGDHLESGLMKFSQVNPKARHVFLSATMPNVDEIADWLSYVLTGKDTYLLKSVYRPCPLNIHYEKYFDGEGSYAATEMQKAALAAEIVGYYPDDKFIVFAHTKDTLELIRQALVDANIACAIHNADLDKKTRKDVETRFRSDPKLRVVVATSTLSTGVNMPARRVVIAGVHMGIKEASVNSVHQSMGRAGRPAYDPVGDAYVLLPESNFEYHKARIKSPPRIESQMLASVGEKHKSLAFHLVAEICQGSVQSYDDVRDWYKRTLACFQTNELDDKIISDTLELLKKIGAIWMEEDGKIVVTTTGKVASIFYYSPFDVADLRRNFTSLFESGREENDLCLSFALGNQDTHRCGIATKAQKEEMSRYARQVSDLFPGAYMTDAAVKTGYAYYLLLKGMSNKVFAGLCRGLQFDFPRTSEILQALDGFTGKWDKKEWLQRLMLRVTYGVSGPQVYLCQLPHIGKARADKLYNAGYKTISDVVAKSDGLASVIGLNPDKIREIIESAQVLQIKGY